MTITIPAWFTKDFIEFGGQIIPKSEILVIHKARNELILETRGGLPTVREFQTSVSRDLEFNRLVELLCDA